jgi:hypothetical protein
MGDKTMRKFRKKSIFKESIKIGKKMIIIETDSKKYLKEQIEEIKNENKGTHLGKTR